MRFRCWLKDDTEEDGVAIDAYDAHDAAGDACEHWHTHGMWSGDPIHHVIEVYVRDTATRELFIVEVHPEYTVDFYARTTKYAPEPE